MIGVALGRWAYGGGIQALLTPGPTDIEPEVIIEISSSLPGEEPIWIDISAYARSVRTKRGKQRQRDRSQAGTATFVFSNADRRFDPEYEDGDLYGILEPGRRIRARAEWSSVQYPLFDGYIDFIEQDYNGPHEATAAIAITDGFKRLEAAELPGVYETVLEGETALAWYRLDEPTDDTMALQYLIDRTGNGYTGSKVNGVQSVDGLLVDDDNGAMQTQDTGITGLALPDALTPLALPWAIEFWFNSARYDEGPSGANTYAEVIRPFAGPIDALGLPGMLNAFTRNADDGVQVDKIAFSIGNSITPDAFVRGTTSVFDEIDHHIVCVAEAGLALKCYIDGANVSTTVIGTSQPLARQSIAFGVTPHTMNFDEIRVYQGTIPTPAEIANHYTMGTDPWANDTPAERIDRVLDLIDWPTADRDLSATGSALQRTGLGGTALEHLLLIEETELGQVFLTADGKVKYVGRNDMITGDYIVSQATFGDAIDELGYTRMGGYRKSDDTVRNIVRRQREGGAEVVATDAASRAQYGPKTESTSGTQETTDVEAFDRASYRLAHVKDAVSYVSSLELEPRGDPAAMFPVLLAQELGYRITLTRRPQNVGDAIIQDTTVQGIEHTIAPKKWQTRLYIDPLAAQLYFLFDDTLWDADDWRFAA